MARRRKIFNRHSKLLTTMIVVVVLVVAWLVFAHYHKKNATIPATVSAKAGIVGSNTDQGGAVDNKGATNNQTTPQPAWAVSDSGLITVQQPTANTTLSSGDTLSGLAQVDAVQYRVVDNDIGVLAQGSLSVVDGKFSGTLGFKPQASAGELEVFSYDSSYREINEVTIPVNFGT